MISLSGQQLSAATSMVRWPTISAQTILGYLRTYTVDDPEIGPEGVIAISPERLAANVGLSEWAAIRGLRWLTEHRVVVRHRKGRGSAPAVWSIEGDLTRWDVEWRIDREKALLVVALMVSSAPYSAEQTDFCTAAYSAEQTGVMVPIYRRMAVHRGPFAPRTRARSNQFGCSAPHGAEQNLASTGPSPFSLRTTFSASRQQEQEQPPTEETAGALAVLAAVYEVTGHELYDGRHRSRSRVVAAVAELEDVEPIVAELHRARPRQWMQAVEMVCRMARGPAEIRSSGPDMAGRAAALRRQIAQAEHDATERKNLGYPVDDELEAIQNLKDELAKCENGNVTREGAIA